VTVPSLSYSDLVLGQTVCEIRYDMAFLIFDRTGAVCEECKAHYPDLKLIQASPAATSFTFDKRTYAVEQMASRAAVPVAHHDPKVFAAEAAPFFETVLRTLEIPVITRVGLRQTFYQTFPGRDDARNAVRGLNLPLAQPSSHFGIKEPTQEASFRWESDAIGAMLHVGSLPDPVWMQMPGLLQIENNYRDEKKVREGFESVAFVDVDFYTVSPVLRAQWDTEEFITTNSHVIKKGIRGLLSK
jgi:hypothetical protein